MLFTPERLSKLKEFGLSEYAARAYLALLELGATEARDVSRLAKVPLAKVYSTLDQLQERGLVTVTPETPKKYAPVPFAEFIHRLRQAHAEQIRVLRDSQQELAGMFPVVGTTQVGDRGTTTTLRGRRTVLDKMRRCMEDAQREVLLLASDGFALRHHHLKLMLQEAKGRNVDVRAMVAVTPQSAPRLSEMMAYAHLRSKDTLKPAATDVAIGIFDGREALVIHFLPDDASSYHGKDVAIHSGEEAIVKTLQALLDFHWAQSGDAEVEIAAALARRAQETGHLAGERDVAGGVERAGWVHLDA